MKRIFIVFITLFCLSFISANPKAEEEKRDTVTVLIKSNTDAAVNRASHELKLHFDSINHSNALERLRLHEVNHSLLKQLLLNDSMRMHIENLERQKYVANKTTEYLYYFLLMIAGSLLAKGIFEGFKNTGRKHD